MTRLMDNLILLTVNLLVWLRFPVETFRTARAARGVPNIARPQHLAEKFLWRRLFDHNPRFPQLADKLRVRDHIRLSCPDLPLPALLWSHADAASAAAAGVSAGMVIKANHGCAMNFFPTGDESPATCAALYRRWLDTDYSAMRKEWAYRDIPRRVFSESRIKADDLIEISVHCCNGQTAGVAIFFDHKAEIERSSFYGPDGYEIGRFLREGKKWQCCRLGPLDKVLPDAGIVTRAMAAAARIGAGLDYVRVDFLCDGTALYPGELTFYHRAGYVPPTPPGSDNLYSRIANLWDLRQSWFLTSPQTGWRALYAAALARAVRPADRPGNAAPAPRILPQ